MPERLVVIAGALAGRRKPKAARLQESIAKRWRMDGSARADEPVKSRDVIPLLDGWIRRLEREAGAEIAQTR